MQECDPCIYCKMITTRLLNSHTIWHNYHFLLEHLGNFQALISNWSLPANGMQSVPSMWGGQPAKSRKGTSSMLVGSLQCLLLSPEHWWTSSTSVRIKGRGGDRRQGFLVCVCVCVCVCVYMHSVVSESLWPHGLQHARPPCPSPTPGAYSNSCLSSRWCHPAISSPVVPFSSRLPSFPASRSFPNSWLLTSGGQRIVRYCITMFVAAIFCGFSVTSTFFTHSWASQE